MRVKGTSCSPGNGGRETEPQEGRRGRSQPLGWMPAVFPICPLAVSFPREEPGPQRCLGSYLSQHTGAPGNLVQVPIPMQQVCVRPKRLQFQEAPR